MIQNSHGKFENNISSWRHRNLFVQCNNWQSSNGECPFQCTLILLILFSRCIVGIARMAYFQTISNITLLKTSRKRGSPLEHVTKTSCLSWYLNNSLFHFRFLQGIKCAVTLVKLQFCLQKRSILWNTKQFMLVTKQLQFTLSSIKFFVHIMEINGNPNFLLWNILNNVGNQKVWVPIRAERYGQKNSIITMIFFISVDIDNYHDKCQIFISFKFNDRFLRQSESCRNQTINFP